MKTAAAVVAAIAAAGVFAAARAQCDSPFDSALCVYPIAEADNQFAVDGQVSAFWADWSGRDSIALYPPEHCYPDRCGFVGPEDASMTIKAAGTSRGLYLLFEVRDNTWVDRSDNEDWGADAVDVFFDKMSAEEITTCTDCLVGLYSSQLTYTTQHMQVWMGATGAPNALRLAYYDDNLWSWQTVGMSFEVAREAYGMELDIITRDAETKLQEWFVPWVSYGKGLDIGMLLDGENLGFSAGYCDKDGDNTNPDCIYWLGKNPWAGDGVYWGDIELLAGMGTVAPCTVEDIDVLEPNGGEQWQTGSAHSIRWRAPDSVDDVTIEYSVNNGQDWGVITSLTPNDGFHSWTVPDQLSSTCLIRVSDAHNADLVDTSDAPFAIVLPPPPGIEVTDPIAGMSLTAGAGMTINWTTTGQVGPVTIDYSIDRGASWTTIVPSTANDGSYPWTIPDTPSDSCLVRVGEAADGDPSDTCDGVFAIVEPPPPAITVVSPNGGDTLQSGTTHFIRWSSHGGVGRVKIEYSANAGADWAVVSAGTANDGVLQWPIPNTPSNGCLVRIYEAADRVPCDTSDTTFVILGPPSLTLTAPNGGEVWETGTMQVITWRSRGPVGNVTIEYSTNRGRSWNGVFGNTANDGSYSWPVPDTPSDSCLVRVFQTVGGRPGDTSDAVFTLERPTGVRAGRPLPSSSGLLRVSAGPGGGFAVSYALASPEIVAADVYTVKGELVRRFAPAHMPGGYHTLSWDGANGRGGAVHGGLCVLRLRLGETVIERGIAVAR